MNETVLLRFLSSGLINVGGDDAKLGKLQATSSEVSAALKQNPAKTPNYALIALDPQAPTTDPVVLEVLETLKNLWPTYINTFAGTPIGVLRPIILDALVDAASEDDRVAVAFAACARNVLSFMETGNEKSIWIDVVERIEAAVDARAEQEWATPAGINIGPLQLQAPPAIKITNAVGKVDREALRPKLVSASGGNNQGNPHWPQNNPTAWAQSLGSGFTDAISDVIDGLAAQSKIGPVDLSAPLQQITTAVSTYIAQVLQAVSGATAGLQRRTNLVWWKQALFSSSMQKSYRDFSPTVAASLMSLYLYKHIPMFSPSSVSAFLEETVRSIQISPAAQPIPLKDLLKETCESPALEPLRAEAAKLYSSPSGRSPVSSLIAHPEKLNALNSSSLRNILGVQPEALLDRKSVV